MWEWLLLHFFWSAAQLGDHLISTFMRSNERNMEPHLCERFNSIRLPNGCRTLKSIQCFWVALLTKIRWFSLSLEPSAHERWRDARSIWLGILWLFRRCYPKVCVDDKTLILSTAHAKKQQTGEENWCNSDRVNETICFAHVFFLHFDRRSLSFRCIFVLLSTAPVIASDCRLKTKKHRMCSRVRMDPSGSHSLQTADNRFVVLTYVGVWRLARHPKWKQNVMRWGRRGKANDNKRNSLK